MIYEKRRVRGKAACSSKAINGGSPSPMSSIATALRDELMVAAEVLLNRYKMPSKDAAPTMRQPQNSLKPRT